MGRKRVHHPDRPSTGSERMKAFQERQRARKAALLAKGLVETPVTVEVDKLEVIAAYCAKKKLDQPELIGRVISAGIDMLVRSINEEREAEKKAAIAEAIAAIEEAA